MQSMLLMFEVVAFAVLAVLVVTTAKLAFKEDGTFRILHISDVHYEIPANGTNGPCQNVSLAQLPCNEKNASSFLSWLIEKEEPDLIVFTGDIIDWATDPAKEGMTEYYEIASQYNVPWAASLGNHDDNSPSMKNRSEVLEFVESLPGTLTEMGPVSGTYGNFILEIFAAQTDANPVFRTYHFDSTTHIASIQKDQVDWYKEQSAALNAVQATPALAFYHIPLTEYAIAMLEKKPYSGNHNEKIQPQPLNTGLFDAFIEQQDVKAGFCGHDHINDFCILYKGVHLCYEGSPGWQAYGKDGFPRRARVTELRDFGRNVVTWKRLDTSIGEGEKVDEETLWAAEKSASECGAHQSGMSCLSGVSGEEAARRTGGPVASKKVSTQEYINDLPQFHQVPGVV